MLRLQRRGACRRARHDGPSVVEGVAIRIERACAVEHGDLPRRHGLARPGVGDRPDVRRGNGHSRWPGIGFAVAHLQLRHVDAGPIDDDIGDHGVGARQRRRASQRLTRQRPAIQQPVAIHVGRAAPIQVHRRADRSGLPETGVAHGRRVSRVDGDEGRRASFAPIEHNQSSDVPARSIGHERRRHLRSAGERRLRALGHRLQRPEIREPIAIHVARARPGHTTHRSERHRLVRAGVGDGRRVPGVDGHGVGAGVRRAVTHDETHHVGAWHVGHERRGDAGGVGERGLTERRARRETPVERQRVTVEIGRSTAVQMHRAQHVRRLIHAGVRRGPPVRGGDRDGRRSAVDGAVADDQQHPIGAGSIGDEGRPAGSGVDQRRLTADGPGDEHPRTRQSIAVWITGAATIEQHRRAQRNRLVRARDRTRGAVDRAW